MQLTLGDLRLSEPTGQHTLSLVLTNSSIHACYVFGYPTIGLLDGAGREIPFVYQQSGDQVVTSQPPNRVDLRPGDEAYVTINKYRCDLGDQDAVQMVDLLLPHETAPLRLVLPPTAMSISYCGPSGPGSTIEISPFASSFRDTLAVH